MTRMPRSPKRKFVNRSYSTLSVLSAALLTIFSSAARADETKSVAVTTTQAGSSAENTEITLSNVTLEGMDRTAPAAGEKVEAHKMLKSVGQRHYALPSLDVETRLAKHGLGRTAQQCDVGPIPTPFSVALRLGATVSPRTRFAGGVDVTIPGLSIAPGFSTRIDADAIVSANFGGVSTLFPLTFDQVFNIPMPVGPSLYVGGGIGPYIGERTRFGGKLFVGSKLTQHFGLEGTLHFQGFGDPDFAIQARFPF